MIVCSCNCIDHHAIEAAVDDLLAGDPLRLVTPVAVYRHLDRRPRCGGCMPLAANLVQARADHCRRCAGCPLAPIGPGADAATPATLRVEAAIDPNTAARVGV